MSDSMGEGIHPRAVPLTPECRAALEKSPTQRDMDDLNQLIDFSRPLKAFQDIPGDVRTGIARSIFYEKLPANHIIAEGSNLWVPLNPSTTITTPGGGGRQASVSTVACGEAMGELALLEPNVKSSVTLMEEAEAIRLEKDDYDRLLKGTHGQSLLEKVSLLRRIGIFRFMPRTSLAALCDALELHHIAPRKVIIKQGTEPDGLYLLVSGQCRVIKAVHVGSGSSSVIKLLEIGVLRKDSFFGEVALLKPCKRTASVVSVTNCVVYLLPKTVFARCVFGESLNEMQEHVEKYPRNEDIVDAWQQQHRWEAYRSRVVEKVLRDKEVDSQ